MKQTVLSYEFNDDGTLFNIGDYIQSIAAEQFIDRTTALQYINRECLNEYHGEKCRLILNGWFMHNAKNWPPSNDIEPLFVSFHINNTVRKQFAKPESIAYFKAHQPIGCRDQSSVDFLSSHGIEAYLSRCLTLTLGRTYKNDRKNGPVLIVDPFVNHYVGSKPRITDILPYLATLLSKARLLGKVRRKLYKDINDGWLKSWVNTIHYYRTFRAILTEDVMLNANYISHVLERKKYPTQESRFEKAKELLSLYSTASYVVTSRIHCALPCLAMDTSVAYVINVDENDISHCRFDGITELFKLIKISSIEARVIHSDFKERLTSGSQFTNNSSHKQYADAMSKTCLEFFRQ